MICQLIPELYVYSLYRDPDGGGFGDGSDCCEYEDGGYSDVYWGVGYGLDGNGYGDGYQYGTDRPILDVPT